MARFVFPCFPCARWAFETDTLLHKPNNFITLSNYLFNFQTKQIFMKKVFFAVIISGLVVLPACTCGDNSCTATKSTSEAVMENIMNRRSIRDYKLEQVAQDTIDLIIKAAINAPSARNLQPWEVRVIKDENMLSKMRAINDKAFFNAPALIVVAYDTTNFYAPFDCGLLTQNILLSAESFGLGTCVVGNVARLLNADTPESKEVLGTLEFSEGYEVIVGISLGYKNQFPEAKPRDTNKVRVIG